MSKIYIDYNSRTLVFENNGISFSQMGIAKEILDLIVNQQDRIDKAIEYIKENTEIALVNGESQKLIDQEDIPIILEILRGKENETN